MDRSKEGVVNLPYGLPPSYNGAGRLLYNDDGDSRPFFVPPGFMRIGLEEHRARCCPPGLYDLEPHEKFQAVLMKFCPPNQASEFDAVIDVPTGDFTESVAIRKPTRDIADLQLVVQARVTAMRKFALANSSNPGAIVYMIICKQVVQHLQGRQPPATLSSARVLNALNEKTAAIGLSIRSVFVDEVVYHSRFGPNPVPAKRFGAPAPGFRPPTQAVPPAPVPDPVPVNNDIKQLPATGERNEPDVPKSPKSRDDAVTENDAVVDTTPPMMLGRQYSSYPASDSDDICGMFASNRLRPPRRSEANLLARMAMAAQTSLFPGKIQAAENDSDRFSSASSSTWSLCDADGRDENTDSCLCEGHNDDVDDAAEHQS